MTRMAIIPARGGSKRIPRKNIKPFCGVPMLTRAIGSAMESQLFDRIVVSTDCDEIAELARQSRVDVPFRRPADLSDDHATTVDVIAHAIEALRAEGAGIDLVCCLYPCTPFTKGEQLRAGYAALSESGSDFAFPVCAFPSAPQRALKRNADGTTAPLDARFASTRTQDLEPAFYDAGQFYWGTADAWMRRLPIHAHAKTIVVDWTAGIDIDTSEDWLKAETLYTAIHAEGHPR